MAFPRPFSGENRLLKYNFYRKQKSESQKKYAVDGKKMIFYQYSIFFLLRRIRSCVYDGSAVKIQAAIQLFH